jgi:hypothetical protein
MPVSALLPIRFIAPINRPIVKALRPILSVLEKIIKGLVGHKVGVEVHYNLLVLNAGWLAPIIAVTESIDIQALTGKVLNILNTNVVLEDEALDTGRLVTVMPVRMLLKPKGHWLNEGGLAANIGIFVVFPEFFE